MKNICLYLLILGILYSCKDSEIKPIVIENDSLAWTVLVQSPIVRAGIAAGDPTVEYVAGERKPWKLWFGYAHSVNDPDTGTELRAEVGYAESADAINWEVRADPVLTTSAMGGWDHKTTEVPTVIYDKNETDLSKKYKLWYSGRNTHDFGADSLRYGIGYAYSPDGINWTKLPGEQSPYGKAGLILTKDDISRFPGIPQHITEPEVIQENGQFIMWVQIWATDSTYDYGIEASMRAVSSDGIYWTPDYDNLLFAEPSETDGNDNGLGQLAIITNNGSYEMWYTIEQDNNDEYLEHTKIKHRKSVDGIFWSTAEVILESEAGTPFWFGPGIDVIMVDDEKYMFYSGFENSMVDGFYIFCAKEE